MRQAILEAPRRLGWRELAPAQPQPGEVIVAVRAALTCGTDLKTYRRGHPKLAFGPFGHEASGDVIAVGEGVTAYRPGDPVMWVQTAPCERCECCRAGRENLCRHLTDDMALGAYADAIRLPRHVVRRNLFPKPEGLSYIEAAFLEPFSCIVHGWRVLARVHAGAPSGRIAPANAGVPSLRGEHTTQKAAHRAELPAHVAIVGAGTIGLLHLAYARQAGVAATVFGRGTNRLALAERLGAGAVVNLEGRDVPGDVQASFAAVFECAGTAEAWQTALSLAAPGGSVVFFSGLPEGTQVPLDAGRIHYEEIACLGSFHFTPDDVREARALLVAGAVPARELISGVLPLSALEDAFANLDARRGYKYALVPDGAPAEWV
jgi:L-iditol 2-dehydrogenase